MARSSGGCCGGGKQGWWNDASHGTLVAKEFPQIPSCELVEGGCAGCANCIARVDDVEWSLEKEGGVGQQNGVSPGMTSQWQQRWWQERT